LINYQQLVFLKKNNMKIQITEGEIMETPNDFALGAYVRQKMWQEKELRKSNSDEHVILNIKEDGQFISISRDELEVCIVCGKQTDIPVSRHVDYRSRYIDGAGQCCEYCYNL
jgi:hypothetical protein